MGLAQTRRPRSQPSSYGSAAILEAHRTAPAKRVEGRAEEERPVGNPLGTESPLLCDPDCDRQTFDPERRDALEAHQARVHLAGVLVERRERDRREVQLPERARVEELMRGERGQEVDTAEA